MKNAPTTAHYELIDDGSDPEAKRTALRELLVQTSLYDIAIALYDLADVYDVVPTPVTDTCVFIMRASDAMHRASEESGEDIE